MILTFERKLIIGFSFTIVILLSIAFYSYKINHNTVQTGQMIARTNECLYRIQGVMTMLVDIDAGQRGYMLTGNQVFLEPHTQAIADISFYIEKLKALVKDNSIQIARCDTLVDLVDEKIRGSISMIEKRKSMEYQTDVDIESMLESKVVMANVRSLIHRMEQEEKGLLRMRNKKNVAEVKLFNITFFALMATDILILIILFIAIFNTTRARRTAEERIKSLNENLEKNIIELDYTNRELDAFSYSVSHDLRSPLRSIDGYTKILQEDYADRFDDEGRRVMDVIKRNAQKMGHLIDDLLAFSRLNKADLVKSNIDMNKLVHSILLDFAIEKNENVKVNLGNLATAFGDIKMIKQVWINLISNAIKYSSNKVNQIIEIGSLSSARETTYFIKDNGVGFDMQYVNKLFGVFQRLHNQSEFEGTGVGLAIVQRIIAKHKGKVSAEAKIGEGAAFYIVLPNKN
ncbi:MAG TPA: CHASE3 domain-containing protein [Cytophagaceae bacterium]|jgi:signal transduction histidine kinase